MKRFFSLIVCLCILTTITSIYIPALSAETSYIDFECPDMPQNLFLTPSRVNSFTGRWHNVYDVKAPNHSGGIEGTMRYTLIENPEYPNNNPGIAGGTFVMDENTLGDYKFKKDTSYVISADFKNNSDVNGKFGFMLCASDTNGNVCNPYAYETITAPDDKWHTFKQVITTTCDASKSMNVYYGFPTAASERAPAGTDILYRLGSLYIAEEIPYTFKVTASKSDVSDGDTIEVCATLLNQIGICGNLNQEVEYAVLDYTRNNLATGFQIHKTGSNKAVITVADVTEGIYAVVAKSKAHGIQQTTFIQVGNTQLFVAPDGSDENPGTKDMPLASFEAAVQRVREFKSYGVIIDKVNFRSGEYIIDNVSFTDADSGNESKNMVYTAYNGEKVVFKGTVELNGKNAYHVEDKDILDRLHAHVRDKVMVIDLAYNGITKEDIFNPETMHTAFDANGREYNVLYTNGAEGMLAQWPNGRNYTRRGACAGDYSFYYNEDRVSNWKTAPDFWIASFPSWNFQYMRTYVTKVDSDNRTITVTNAAPYTFADNVHDDGTEPLRRWKAYNLLEEIDLPGEYYIDRENLKLYFYPTCNPADAKLELSVNTKPLVSLQGASNLTFTGLEFAKTCSFGVYGKDIDDVDFANCTFRDIGTYAYFVEGSDKPKTGAGYWQESYLSNDASYNCDIRYCTFDNIGGSAIYTEGGNVDTLTPSGNIIEGNFVSGASVNFINNGAVLVGGVGTTVRNNIISKATQSAVTLYGNDHVISRNEIYAVLRDIGDGGAIYQGRSFLGRGNNISQNYIHDIKGIESTSGIDGIYMDDSQQGNTIEQNIIVNVPTGYNSNGAGDMIFKDNIVVNSDKSWNFHYTSYELHAVEAGRDYTNPDVSMVGTVADLENIILDKELYFTRYPNLKILCETKINPKSFSVISGNLAVNDDALPVNIIREPDIVLSTWENNTIEIADIESIFADSANHDYRLKADSKYALSSPGLLNQNNFDMSLIGTKCEFETEEDIKLLYPVDTNVSASGFEFFWEDVFGADKYIIEVSGDKAFSDVILRECTDTNIYTAHKGLFESEKIYYWRVTAQSSSKNMGTICVSNEKIFYATDILITNTTTTIDKGQISFNFTIINTSDTNITADVYVVFYDKDHVLKELIPYSNLLLDNVHRSVVFDTENKYEISEIKIMVWSKGTLKPMRKPALIS